MWIKRLEALLGVVAGTAIFGMMLVTFLDVFGRYVLGKALLGAMEVVEVLLVITVFSGLALAALSRSHIEIDLLEQRLPQRLWSSFFVLASLLFAAGMGAASYLLAQQALQLALDGETTMLLQVPLAGVAWGVCALLALTSLIHLVVAIQACLRPAVSSGFSAQESSP